MYQVNNQGKCALRAVRTWHYDAQIANGLITNYHSGVYPRATLVDSQANPVNLRKWMRKQGYEFNPAYSIKGFGKSSGGSGGDLTVSFALSGTSGLTVILDTEHFALLVYEVNARGVKFCVCRSILAEIQIPFYFPDKVAKPNPLEIRKKLLDLAKDINKKNPKYPLKVKESKELDAMNPENKDKKDDKKGAEKGDVKK